MGRSHTKHRKSVFSYLSREQYRRLRSLPDSVHDEEARAANCLTSRPLSTKKIKPFSLHLNISSVVLRIICLDEYLLAKKDRTFQKQITAMIYLSQLDKITLQQLTLACETNPLFKPLKYSLLTLKQYLDAPIYFEINKEAHKGVRSLLNLDILHLTQAELAEYVHCVRVMTLDCINWLVNKLAAHIEYLCPSADLTELTPCLTNKSARQESDDHRHVRFFLPESNTTDETDTSEERHDTLEIPTLSLSGETH